MGRAPCCDKTKVKRGPWSPDEDATLKNYLENNGTGGNWIALPQKAGLKRCGKSCRLRWLNYLRPDIKHGAFTAEEDNIICTLYTKMGSRWSVIASQLPGRTDNDVKNHWNTKLKKKLHAPKASPATTISTSNPTYNIAPLEPLWANVVPKIEPYNPYFSGFLPQSSQAMLSLTDPSYGLISNSQEAGSYNSLAVNNNYVPWFGNIGDDGPPQDGFSSDFSSGSSSIAGFPYDLITGFWSQQEETVLEAHVNQTYNSFASLV